VNARVWPADWALDGVRPYNFQVLIPHNQSNASDPLDGSGPRSNFLRGAMTAKDR